MVVESYPVGKRWGRLSNKPFLAVSIALLVVVAAFVVYLVLSLGTISDRNASVSDLQGQVTSARSQISDLQAQVSSVKSELSSIKAQVSSLQNDASTYKSQISTLQSQLSSANAQVASLQSQLSSANAQVASLQSQLSSANAQVASLQSQLSSANAQVASLQSIVSLSKSQTLVNMLTVNQGPGEISLVVSFQADYAGYIVVSGTSTTNSGYISVLDTWPNYPFNGYSYEFGTGMNRTILVMPGTVRVSFGNGNTSNGATATLTVTYYY